jgi:hypothetical protein
LNTPILIFSPSVLLSLIAISLLRHDWKLRRLSSQLIEKNNAIDTAMGILRGSLALSRIGTDNEDLLKESFKQVRIALLFHQQQNISDSAGGNDIIKTLMDLLSKK